MVHLFGEARAVELLSRGRLGVIDVMPEPGRPSRRAALHDLSLLPRTRDGALHPFSSHATWLRRAGLEPTARRRLERDWETTLVIAIHAADEMSQHLDGCTCGCQANPIP